MKQKPKPKSDKEANKLIAWAGKTILGPGVRERIKRDAARPRKYPGNTGILFLPEWQDAVLDNPQPAKKRESDYKSPAPPSPSKDANGV